MTRYAASASTLGALVAAIGVAIALSAGCFAGSAPQTLPAFALTNQSGAMVRADRLHGRVAIVSFIFSNCYEACPLVIPQLARARTELAAVGLGPAVRFISITLDPDTDTPEVLRAYSARLGVETDAWDFLTGEPAEVRRVVRALGVVVVREGGSVGHDSPVLLVDAHGAIARRYADAGQLSARIVDDVRRLRPGTPRGT